MEKIKKKKGWAGKKEKVKKNSIFVLLMVIVDIFILGLYLSLIFKAKINKQEVFSRNMKITSPDFENNSKIPVKFTGDGENINPNLDILGVPENTQSLVLLVEDPDAPAGTWNHWIVFNIPAATVRISENSIPGIQGKNSWDKNEYGGPMPPSGTHRYFFKVYALDIDLALDENIDKNGVELAIENHILDKAELIGLYR